MDKTHDGWTPPHNRRVVPLYGRIQVTLPRGKRISRPRGLSGLQGILNGNNLHPTVNPSQ